MFTKIGRVSQAVKPSVLRCFYKNLTGDQSASSNLHQAEVDERVKRIIEMEDPDIVDDLRRHNGKQGTLYEDFWTEC
uniref:Uncharacterized protein n=1 Tax=Amphimedon queenslandica TaxID=400682 RepID=A0A1X7TZ64_AMPQE